MRRSMLLFPGTTLMSLAREYAMPLLTITVEGAAPTLGTARYKGRCTSATHTAHRVGHPECARVLRSASDSLLGRRRPMRRRHATGRVDRFISMVRLFVGGLDHHRQSSRSGPCIPRYPAAHARCRKTFVWNDALFWSDGTHGITGVREIISASSSRARTASLNDAGKVVADNLRRRRGWPRPGLACEADYESHLPCFGRSDDLHLIQATWGRSIVC